jgi:parallel beta-helix repeat protein
MKTNTLILVFCTILFVGNSIFPLVQGLHSDSETFFPLKQEKRNSLETLVLPSSFSWRDINGTDFTTPIRNQKPYPSCETFALVAAVETMVQYNVGYPFGCDLSEAHLFFYSGGNIGWGSYPENDTRFLKEYGVPDEACWPYPQDKNQYPLNTTSPDWKNRTVKISDWSYLLDDPIAIKTALVTNGPVPSYFLVYQDFLYHKNGIYQHRWGKVRGPHYMAIVGYNDDPGYWIVKNSWGTNYQEDGWVKIKYGECGIGKKSFYLTGVYGRFPINYVDDNNTNGPWDGTKEYPFHTIQEAVNHVYNGYTIYVRNGTYEEHLIINKTINLDGENKNTTIIDGGRIDDVVTVSVPGVTISGLTIQNSGTQTYNAGLKTLSLNSNVTIVNNIIQRNAIGIYLNYAYEQSWNIVQNNTIQNNTKGIYAHWANSGQITGNMITLNDENGIEMEHCKRSNITRNIISNNGDCGIYLRGASNENSINAKNTIQNNTIGLKLTESNKNVISNNNFINNSKQAFFSNALFTKWKNNYWNDWPHFRPRMVRGSIGLSDLPWVNFDWHPIRKPYNISYVDSYPLPYHFS